MSEIDRYGLEQYADVLWPMDEGRLVFYDDHLAAVAKLEAEVARLRVAAERFLEMYVMRVNSGDWGNWDPEGVEEVIALRKALAGEGE